MLELVERDSRMRSADVEATLSLDGDLLPYGHIAFLDDGKRMITGAMLGTLSFWDWRANRKVASLKRTLYMSPIVPLPRSHRIAAVDDKIRVYDATEGIEIMKFPVDREEGPPANITVSSDGRLMASAAWQAQSILVRSMTSGKVLVRIPEYERPGATVHRKLALSSTGSVLAVGVRDVRLWRLLLVDASDGE